MHHFAIAFAALCTLATAQAGPSSVCQAASNNNTYLSGTSMGGPNLLLGIQTTAPSSYLASRIEVFTGNGTGQNSLAVWTHDAVNNRPLAMVAQGTWQMMRIRGWQGANLSQPVSLSQGQIFWVVWGPVNGSQISAETATGPGSQPYRGSFDGGQSWNGPYQSYPWKFRIYCGSPGHYEVFGNGCAGSSRTLPDLGWSGIPTINASMNVLLDHAVANDFALLMIGDSNTSYGTTPLPFALSANGAPGCAIQCAPVASVFTLTDAAGQAAATVAIPGNGALFGFQFYDQWFVHDAAANQLGFKVSNGGAGIVGL